MSSERRRKLEMDAGKKASDAKKESPGYRFSFLFRRYFEDFKSYEYLDEQGQKHLRKVYTGRYYTPPFSKKRYALRKLVYALLFLAAAVLVGFAGTRFLEVNLFWGTVILSIFCVLGLCWVMIALFNYLIAPYTRTIGDQKTSTGMMIPACIWTVAALALAAVENAVYLVFRQQKTAEQLLCVVCYLAAAGLLLLLRELERRVKYLNQKADTKDWNIIRNFETAESEESGNETI